MAARRRRRGSVASMDLLAYRLRSFKSSIRREITRIMRERAGEVEDMITEGQLYGSGVTGKGRPLPPYAPKTVKKKQKRGQRYDHMTLRDTGKFHKSVRLRHTRNAFVVESSDKKADVLMGKYGNDILTLSRANLKLVINNILRPELARALRNKLKNG